MSRLYEIIIRFALFLALSCSAIAERVGANSVSCEFPKAPQSLDPPKCPKTALSKEDAVAVGKRLAPELRFHPLEKYFLSDPSTYFQTATLNIPRFIMTDPDPTKCPPDKFYCEVEDGSWRNLADLRCAIEATHSVQISRLVTAPLD
jgi:hypothetical protein